MELPFEFGMVRPPPRPLHHLNLSLQLLKEEETAILVLEDNSIIVGSNVVIFVAEVDRIGVGFDLVLREADQI
jgi:hypothetical protein